MCTQKPPHDYSEQLYNRYRDCFSLYITEKVLRLMSTARTQTLLSTRELSCQIVTCADKICAVSGAASLEGQKGRVSAKGAIETMGQPQGHGPVAVKVLQLSRQVHYSKHVLPDVNWLVTSNTWIDVCQS